MSLRLFIKEALIGLLIGAFTFPAPLWANEATSQLPTANAPQAEPTPEAAPSETATTLQPQLSPEQIKARKERRDKELATANKIDADVASLIVQTQFRGAPGVGYPLTSVNLATANQRLQEWRQLLNARLQSATQLTRMEDTIAKESLAVFYVQHYFTLAQRLETLKALTGQRIDPSQWEALYSLKVDLKNFGDYTFLDTIAKLNITSQEGKLFTLTRIEQDKFIITLAHNLVLDIELAKWSQEASATQVRDMAQYQAAKLLVLNLLRSHRLLGDSFNLSAIPVSLRQKFPALTHMPTLAENQWHYAQVKDLVDHILKDPPALLKKLHEHGVYMANTRFLQMIFSVVNPTQANNLESINSSLPEFRSVEEKDLTEVFPNYVRLLNLKDFSHESISKAVIQALADAVATVFRAQLLSEASLQQLNLSNESIEQIRTTIQSSRQAYIEQATPVIRSLVDELAEKQKQSFSKGKVEFNKKMREDAEKIRLFTTSVDVPVAPSALAAAYQSKLKGVELSSVARENLTKVLQGENYTVARQAYFDRLMVQLDFFTPKANLTFYDEEGDFVLANLKNLVKNTPWRDDHFQNLLTKYPEAKARLANMPKTAQADTVGWLAAGEILGFYKFQQREPLVREFDFSKTELKNYRDSILISILSDFPLLAHSVTADSNKEKRPLYQYLTTTPGPQDEALINNAVRDSRDNIILSLQDIAGERVSFANRVAQWFDRQHDTLDEYAKLMLIMQESAYLTAQFSNHPLLAAPAERTISELGDLGPGRKAWERLYRVSQRIMLGLIIYQIAIVWLKLPTKKISEVAHLLYTQAFSSKIRNWISVFLLGSIFTYFTDMGLNAFYIQPSSLDTIKQFTNCGISSPCLTDHKRLKKWEDEISGLQNAFWIEFGIFAVTMIGLVGINYYLQIVRPVRQAKKLTKQLTQDLRDIGFQSERYSLNPEDIRAMADASIKSLNKRTHPALDPNRPSAVASDLSAAQRAQQWVNTQILGAEVSPFATAQRARYWLAREIRSSADRIEATLRSQQVYWRGQFDHYRLRLQAIGLNKWPSEHALTEARVAYNKLRDSGRYSREHQAYIESSFDEVYMLLKPHYDAARTSQVYRSLLHNAWGETYGGQMFAAEAEVAKQFGASYRTVLSFESRVPRNEQVVPYGTRPTAQPNYEVYTSVREVPYRVVNKRWWDYLTKKFTDAADFPMPSGPSGPFVKGPPSYRLLKNETRLLEDLSNRDGLEGFPKGKK